MANMTSLCRVHGCTSRRDGKSSMCGKHRRRLRLYGDVHKTKNNPPGVGFVAFGYRATQINGKKKFDHVRIVESVLGRALSEGAVVHHANGNRSDNRKENLIVCPNRAYHNLLHARMRARDATGDPNSKRCRHCGTYADQESMRTYEKKRGSGTFVNSHPECDRKANSNNRVKS